MSTGLAIFMRKLQISRFTQIINFDIDQEAYKQANFSWNLDGTENTQMLFFF